MTLLAVPGAMAVWLLLGPSAFAAQEPTPTVSFTAIGNPPAVCGARPNVTNLAVPPGNAILLVNETEVDAHVTVGGIPVLDVSDGDGALLVLAAGQHEVRLVPECDKVNNTFALVVNVTAPGAAPTSSGPPSARSGETADGASTGGQADPGDGVSATDPPSDVVVVAGATATPSRAVIRVPDVVSVNAVDLDASLVDPKGVRLVGAIATICVLGVTAAIIRSIVRLNA